MKKFVFKNALAAVAIFAAFAMLDRPYSRMMRDANIPCIESWRSVMYGEAGADMIVLGNSRAFRMVDPVILDSIAGMSCFNLATDGGGINRQLAKYKMYRLRCQKPKVIIQNIDPFTMVHINDFQNEQFLPYFWDRDFRRVVFPYENFRWADRWLPSARFRGCSPLRFCHSEPRHLTRGYSPDSLARWDDSEAWELKGTKFHYEESCLTMFRDFLSEAADEGIKVVFVYAPYHDNLNVIMTGLEGVYELYRPFCEEFGITLFDYTGLEVCHDTTYFYNTTHMNAKGARIYSDTLARDLRNYLRSSCPAE